MRLTPCLALSALASTLILTSCAGSHVNPEVVTANLHLIGKVYGGEQPITGSTIQIYQASSTATSGAAKLISSGTITTSDGTGQVNVNANPGNNNNTLPAGYFNLTGLYTCDSASNEVYLVAEGGNPGISANNPSGVNNTFQNNMAAMGTCSTFQAMSNVTINEVTTVAFVAAFRNNMTGIANVGASSASTLNSLFNTANEYADPSNGFAPGPALPNGYDASANDLRSLANSIQSCVNSNGSSSTPCASLITDSQATLPTAPTDTVTALLDIFAHPTANVSAIFNLGSATPAFLPVNAAAPIDWTLPVLPIPDTPTLSPSGGSYTTVQSVAISVANADTNTKIYYTTDGSTPTSASSLYSSPIALGTNATTNLKAIAVEDSRLSSSIASASYTISGLSTPTVSLSNLATTYGSTTGVTITATSTANGSVVTFGTANGIGGSFSPATCTIASGTCTSSYTPSATLGTGTYTADLTAAFSASGAYTAATATSTLTISTAFNFSLLHSMPGHTDGYVITSGVVQASDGYFYGVTAQGGEFGYGTIYKVSATGSYSIVHAFTNTVTDGTYPESGLTIGADGNIYGLTIAGGTYGSGTLFKLTTAGVFTLVHSFSPTADGANPQGILTQGTDGSFYGTAPTGGSHSDGTVFKIATDGTLTNLHNFAGGTSDGQSPLTGVVFGADGNLYGTTSSGGANGYGCLYQITTAGVISLKHSFNTGTSDSMGSYGGLKLGADGNLYGLSSNGGANGVGTAYSYSTSAGYSLIHSFATTDGAYPSSGLMQIGSTFYAVASSGGANGYGTFFSMTTSGAVTLLHSFATASDGANPRSVLTTGTDGNFYATTTAGGTNGSGTIFNMTTGGTLTVLHAFSSSTPEGVYLGTPPMQAADGNLYTIANSGGANNLGGILKITPAGAVTLIHSFTSAEPTTSSQPLIQGPDGNLYGAGQSGGSSNVGGIFKVTPSGTLTILHLGVYSTSDLSYFNGGLVFGPDGNLYGTATEGGANYAGGIFRITTSGTFTLLHSFTSSTDGSYPNAGLLLSTDGYLYGTVPSGGSNSIGTFYKISTSGTFNLIHAFLRAEGGSSNGPLIQGADGNFYGASTSGDLDGYGAVYKINSSGTVSPLYSFSSGAFSAYGSLLLASDGNFYGTTYNGGSTGYGIAYQVTPAGAFTTLHSFTSATTDGNHPESGLIQASNGAFYGVTYYGGTDNFGAIYKITPAPSFASPVTISAPATVTHGTSFTLNSSVSNAYSGTLQSCFASVTSSAGVFTYLGAVTGSPTGTNTNLTAPATTGTYTLSLTCGGQESTTTTLTVQ